MTKQEAAIKYITENYLDYRRLRHDIVADKLQIRMADSLSAPHNATSVIGDPAEFRLDEGNTSLLFTPCSLIQTKNYGKNWLFIPSGDSPR